MRTNKIINLESLFFTVAVFIVTKINGQVSTPAGARGWYMSHSEATVKVISSDQIFISLPFNTSNRDHGVSLYTENCFSSFNSSDDYFDVNTTNPTSVNADGFIQFNTSMTMNITAINGTGYWNDFIDSTRGGWVLACVQTYLLFSDVPELGNVNDSEQKVIFRNNLMNITVSLTQDFSSTSSTTNGNTTNGSGGFTTDVIEPEKIELKPDFTELAVISVYECDENDLEKEAKGKSYKQGDFLMICATSDGDPSLELDKFKGVWVVHGDKVYNYVRDGKYNPEITTPVCVDRTSSNRLCYVKMITLARFFLTTEPTSIELFGSIYLRRTDQVERRDVYLPPASPYVMKGNDNGSDAAISGRRANEEKDGAGDFYLIINLEPSINSRGSSKGKSDASVKYGPGENSMISMLVGVAGAALLAY